MKSLFSFIISLLLVCTFSCWRNSCFSQQNESFEYGYYQSHPENYDYWESYNNQNYHDEHLYNFASKYFNQNPHLSDYDYLEQGSYTGQDWEAYLIETETYDNQDNQAFTSKFKMPNGSLWISGEYQGPILSTHIGDSFRLHYEEPGTSTKGVARLVFGSGIFEAIMTEMESIFQLPSPIDIIFTSGKPGPIYYNGIIHISYEFLDHINTMYKRDDDSMSEEDRAAIILDMAEFMYYHELGHAIVDILDIPVVGKVEDAVDHFAAILATENDLEQVVITAIDYFDLSSWQTEQELKASNFWSAHSMDAQRMYSIACLLYGKNITNNRELANSLGFPPEMADRCKTEYDQASRNWSRLLGNALKN